MKALKCVYDVKSVMEELENGCPAIDWRAKLEEYLARHKKQKDAAATVKSLESKLDPWVDWLIDNGSRPTTQRIL